MSGYYSEHIAATYDASSPGIPGDVDFYLALARDAHAAGQPVLELACGTGRVAIPIAQEGIQIVGLDGSPAMLDLARSKSAGLEYARWVEGDMASFALPERFGFAFIAYRSFQHLLTTEEQLSCLRCVREHLTPGGRLALNVFNPDIVAIARWLSANRGGSQRMPDYQHPESNNTVLRWESRDYRTSIQEVDTTRCHEELDGAGAVLSRNYRSFTLRYLHRFEMEHLLARAGFETEALYGDFFGAPLGDTSPEMVWVARRSDA